MIGAHDVSDEDWEGTRRRLEGGERKTWRHRGFWHIRRPMAPLPGRRGVTFRSESQEVERFRYFDLAI